MFLATHSAGFGVGAAAAATDPTTGMRLWLRGTDLTQSGGLVSSWNDKSGNSYHFTQSTDSLKPTYDATGGPLSTPILTFDGTADYLASTAVVSDIKAAGAGTVFIVFKATSAGGDDIATSASLKLTLLADTGDYLKYGLGATKTWAANFDGSYDVNQLAFSTGTWYIMEARHESGTWYERISGVTEASKASGNTQVLTNVLQVGWDIGAGTFLAGSIAEIIAYNTALSTADLTTTSSYLQGRYGLAR